MGESNKMTEKITNDELRKAIKQKAKRAKPIVKADMVKMIKYANKAELRRIMRNMRVTRGGDIDISRRKNK